MLLKLHLAQMISANQVHKFMVLVNERSAADQLQRLEVSDEHQTEFGFELTQSTLNPHPHVSVELRQRYANSLAVAVRRGEEERRGEEGEEEGGGSGEREAAGRVGGRRNGGRWRSGGC